MAPRSDLILATLIATIAQSAAAVAAAAAPPPSTYTLPAWLKQPTAAQTAAVYPSHAQRAGIAGSATIRCKVTISGDLEDCSVSTETPARMDFGAAALKLAPFMKMTPKLQDNVPVEGTVTIPLRFGQQDEGPDSLLAGGPILFIAPQGR